MRNVVVLLLSLVLACMPVVAQTTIQKVPAPLDARTLQKAALTAYKPSVFPEVYKTTAGLAGAYAKSSTNEVWLTAIVVPPLGSTVAEAGYYSSPMKNQGTMDWSADVYVSFDVLKLGGEGTVGLMVDCQEKRGDTWYTMGVNNDVITVASLGPNRPFHSKIFAMKPNTEYRGLAYISFRSATPGNSAYCYAKITAISWDFP